MRSRAASISCTEANSIGRVPQGQQILAHGGIRKLYFADRVVASDYAVFPLRQNKGLGVRLKWPIVWAERGMGCGGNGEPYPG